MTILYLVELSYLFTREVLLLYILVNEFSYILTDG